jgi:hypothetical protein
MPAWPKNLLMFGAGLRTALTELRLRQKTLAPGDQRRAFNHLTRELARTTFWREAGITAGMSYDDFRSRVAVRSHVQLAPAITRMQQGEANVLWPGTCTLFAATSGTTEGHARLLPAPPALLAHFRHSIRESLLSYTVRMGHAGIFGGRHLYLGGSTAAGELPAGAATGSECAELGGILVRALEGSSAQQLIEPPREISDQSEGLAKFDAIAARTAQQDLTLIAGLPDWVLQFAQALRDTTPRPSGRLPHLQALWPNLECLVHGGVPVAAFQRGLREVLGPDVRFHEVYPACEAFVAAQDGPTAAGLRVLTHTGVFYELLPVAAYDESRLDQIGAKAIPLTKGTVGQNYVLLITTPGGLARYVLGDVVRLTSVEPPRLTYVGRTSLQLNAFNERVTEREIGEALLTVCSRQEWSLVNFHVAPRFTPTLPGQVRGNHEWWIELRPVTRLTPIGPQVGAGVDVELQRLNPDYATRRKDGIIGAPTVRLVMPGVFEHWLRYRGQWGAQNKTPHCRSDRLVADELKKITNFAQD